MSARTPGKLVLIGGGHAHLFVLRAFALQPDPLIEVTLIAKEVMAPYSGMLPGFVAGFYKLEDCVIDLERLCRFAGIRLIHASATGLDRLQRTVEIAGHEAVPYDAVSIDVGITPDLGGIAGAADHALAVKPISVFAPKWQALEARALGPDGPRRFAVIGGGPAGFEIALAVRHRLRHLFQREYRDPGALEFKLVTAGRLLPSHNNRSRRLAEAALLNAGIALREGVAVTEVARDFITLGNGDRLPTDSAILTTGARAPDWFSGLGLAQNAGGYLAVHPTLQTYSDERVFAAGDCASVIAYPREKAGVFAVRQGPVLAGNLRRFFRWQRLTPHIPQRRFLTLMSLGNKTAIASRGPLAAHGYWAWLLKDAIDRGFMTKFQSLGRD